MINLFPIKPGEVPNRNTAKSVGTINRQLHSVGQTDAGAAHDPATILPTNAYLILARDRARHDLDAALGGDGTAGKRDDACASALAAVPSFTRCGYRLHGHEPDLPAVRASSHVATSVASQPIERAPTFCGSGNSPRARLRHSVAWETAAIFKTSFSRINSGKDAIGRGLLCGAMNTYCPREAE